MARVRSGGRSVMVASSGGSSSSRRLGDSAFRFGGQSKTWSSVIKYCVLKAPRWRAVKWEGVIQALSGACLRTLRTSSGTTSQLPSQRA
jgi:hypothetical protein